MELKEVEKVLSKVRTKFKEFDLDVKLMDVSENGIVRVKLSGGRAGCSGKSCKMGRRNSPAKGSKSLSREGAKLMLKDTLVDEIPDIKKVEIV